MVVAASKVRTTAMGAVEPATGMVIWYSPHDTLSLLQGTCHKIHVSQDTRVTRYTWHKIHVAQDAQGTRVTHHLYGHPAPPAAALVAAMVTLPCKRIEY